MLQQLVLPPLPIQSGSKTELPLGRTQDGEGTQGLKEGQLDDEDLSSDRKAPVF